MPDTLVTQPLPEVAPLMLAGSSTRTLVVSSFCCVQHWRQGLGWGGPAQKCSSGAAGSHAGRSCKQGNRQERSSPQTGNSLSPRGGHRKPKPFPRPREQKSPRCLERAKGQASASLPRHIVAGWQGSDSARGSPSAWLLPANLQNR